MSYATINVNSVTYSSGVLTTNLNYQWLRGGGSVSIAGLPSTLYYSVTFSYGTSIVSTYSISLSASTLYNLTFSFYTGGYINYPLDQPSIIGITGASSYILGGVPYNEGFVPVLNPTTLYQSLRTYNYNFQT